MTHWSETYVGRSWVRDEYDCASLVRDVADDILDLDVSIPSEREWRRRPPEEIAELGSTWARPCESPEEFDVVLMEIVGKIGIVGSHIGIHSKVGTRRWVLHNIEGHGVIFTPETNLSMLCLEVVGYYRWLPSTAETPTHPR